MKYSAPRGTRDILPEETRLWQDLEKTCRRVFDLYNYAEIRTPIFESTGLFSRSIGKTTDIVKKEMYEFLDRKGRSLTLRPEETAAVVRAGLENNLFAPGQLTKLYYIGPMFRYERPQKGRQRQFHQAGVEAFGAGGALIDVEVIVMNVQLFKALGLKDLKVNLNSVGCKKCQPEFRKKIKAYFKENIAHMCPDCREREEINPLRILDCKAPGCQGYIENAPASVDALCAECGKHFQEVVGGLGDSNLKFQINNRLVRGLDYYTKTVFEIFSDLLGAQNAVSGGGRYDTLVEEFGGKPAPATGFAIGLERVIEILKSNIQTSKSQQGIQLFIAALGDEAKKAGFDLLSKAREAGISADMDYLDKSLKAQMKSADKIGARFVYIIGETELAKRSAVLKDMRSGEQRVIAFDELTASLG